ncbi:BON domain-containing protein [Giesbergeria anulus]|uniref:Osmotically-inducible protein OsmY, contains BON domain n=1 Tax=Giesbergeria anulus TaxID=180197 RepID=A0A1H9K6H3_9BURK|nr:BON domain-containing protein [Giesbergeria anulus]SEQ94720.1 Osmotically-inducible protein OsmY, contains BON domain [Giesbergeria anulus]
MQKFSTRRVGALLLAASTLAATLAGCAPVVLGGVALSGIVAADRRTTGTQVEDESIELHAVNLLHGHYGDRIHVNITSYNRQVLLTGEVPTAADRQRVQELVRGLENVRSVVNELGALPNTSLAQRSNDTFITGKVRASLVDAKDLTANAFKVVTERGVVYLLGRVTQREAQRAASLASGVTGVVKVVRVFESLSEEELSRMSIIRPDTAGNGNASPR